MPPGSTLQRLVGDTARFAADHWGAVPLHVTATDHGAGFDDVLTLEQFDAWLASTPRRPTVRLIRDGVDLPERRYCTTTRLGSRTFGDAIDLDRVTALFLSGATIAAQSLHRLMPSVTDFAAELEREISFRVQVNAYLSPPGGVGLTPHCDRHDVIVVQLHGHKRWKIDGVGDVVVARGDRLYIPAATRHEASTGNQPSLHLTIGIHPVTHALLAERAIRSIEALRGPLPLGYTHLTRRQLAALVADSLANTIDELQALDAETFAATMSPPTTRNSVGRLSAAMAADSIDEATVVRRRVAATLHDDDAPNRVTLRFAATTMRLPRTTRQSLERLNQGDAVAVGQLPGLDPISRLVVVRRLLRDGYLMAVEPGNRSPDSSD